LIVIEVETRSSGISANSRRMSSTESIATTGLADLALPRAGWSESYPICVGRSKAVDRPVCPFSSR
jgi:hypothetical protein